MRSAAGRRRTLLNLSGRRWIVMVKRVIWEITDFLWYWLAKWAAMNAKAWRDFLRTLGKNAKL